MKQQPIEVVIIESHKENKEIGRQFYRYILEELKKLKGENGNENEEKQKSY